MRARFVRLEWENTAHTIGTVYFKPDRPYYFTPGQYANLTVPHPVPDNRGLTRTMTITSSAAAQDIGITTRFFPGKQSTYKQALLNLKPGAQVHVSDAMGDLVLPLDSSVPLVFVAGGVGIASYISMIRFLTERTDTRQITLIYALNNVTDCVFQNIIDTYRSIGALTKILCTTDHKADSLSWDGEVRKSRLTAHDIAPYTGDDAQIYISGSHSMVEQLRTDLASKYHIPQYRIVFDYFDGYVET